MVRDSFEVYVRGKLLKSRLRTGELALKNVDVSHHTRIFSRGGEKFFS
jgi:hypothetical protein